MRAPPSVQTGLDRLRAGDGPPLRGVPIALLCHPAAVTWRLGHAIDVLGGPVGATIVALLGPEHGVDAAAQDMEIVGQGDLDQTSAIPTYSLYGADFASLRPTAAMFHGAAWLVCDLQDIGARYYTYVWTILLAAEAALEAGLRVLILDRPNPLGGGDEAVEGGGIDPGEASFVGLHDVAVRHGLTIGELVTMALAERGVAGRERVEVLECAGWRRRMLFPETGLPWVLPSPNMPTWETAMVYPGQCLWEGTNLSEGRGLTRPFEVFGAPFVDGQALAAAIPPEDRPGLALRPCTFKPMFHKFAGQRCGGVQLHITDPAALRSLRSTWALLRAVYHQAAGALRWRTEPYEFVGDRPAIDLLAGGPGLRQAIEAGVPTAEWAASQEAGRRGFLQRRQAFLRYPH